MLNARPPMYGIKMSVLMQKYIRRLRATEMKYLQKTVWFTMYDNLEHLYLQPLEEDKYLHTEVDSFNVISRMPLDRIPKILLQYLPQTQNDLDAHINAFWFLSS